MLILVKKYTLGFLQCVMRKLQGKYSGKVFQLQPASEADTTMREMTHDPRDWYFGQWYETSCFLCTSWLLQEQKIYFLSVRLTESEAPLWLFERKRVEGKNLYRTLHNRKTHICNDKSPSVQKHKQWQWCYSWEKGALYKKTLNFEKIIIKIRWYDGVVRTELSHWKNEAVYQTGRV